MNWIDWFRRNVEDFARADSFASNAMTRRFVNRAKALVIAPIAEEQESWLATTSPRMGCVLVSAAAGGRCAHHAVVMVYFEGGRMSASRYIHLDVARIERETDKAFLLILEDGEEVWIPKNQIADVDDYEEGDTNCSVSVTIWIAEQKGLA